MNENNNLIFESEKQNIANAQPATSEPTPIVNSKKTKGNKGLIIILIIIIVGLTGFIVYDKFIANDSTKCEEKQTTEVEDTTNKEEKQEARDLTEDELNSFKTFFNEYSINGFVTQQYNSAKEIKIDYVVYMGLGDKKEVTEEELIEYTGNPDAKLNEMPTSLHKLLKEDVKKHMKKYAGIEDLSNFKWKYIEKYDAYYRMYGDARYAEITSCSSGKIDENGNYIVTCTNSEGTFEATMKKSNDTYMFVSNKCVKDCKYMYTEE